MQFPDPGVDPFTVFGQWLDKAREIDPEGYDVMMLATADQAGQPSVRAVLLKGYDESGFVFYTNYESRKGVQLRNNPKAALAFYWKELDCQVRAEGLVEQVTEAEADAYFASRPRGAQIGAWASEQSRPLEARETLEQRVLEFEQKFAGQDVPRPAYWSGFRLVPQRLEFWQQREFRLHDRMAFVRKNKGWAGERLYP